MTVLCVSGDRDSCLRFLNITLGQTSPQTNVSIYFTNGITCLLAISKYLCVRLISAVNYVARVGLHEKC